MSGPPPNGRQPRAPSDDPQRAMWLGVRRGCLVIIAAIEDGYGLETALVVRMDTQRLLARAEEVTRSQEARKALGNDAAAAALAEHPERRAR